MTIIIAEKKLIHIDDEGERDAKSGDSPENWYINITLSTNEVFNVKYTLYETEEERALFITDCVSQYQVRLDAAQAAFDDATNLLDKL